MGATCDICKRPKSHGDVLLTVQRDKDAPAFTMCGECWIEWTPTPKRVAAVDTKKAKQRRVAVEIVDGEE